VTFGLWHPLIPATLLNTSFTSPFEEYLNAY
jgi:hypothetical protein